ncbi:malate synthase G [Sphingomonas sp. BK069]|uniref:malate synthase G n=1 Tax=Sphingomonas sp. BK069 TaxID=2586979 RepID=UPI00161595E7|nr:malate synthase G [Sphingomonas sp. BK069]MBB3350062.1 malate synthase [Sphingomonas sp. BK069]
MATYVTRACLSVAAELAAFVEDEALAGTGVSADTFWAGAAAILTRFAPENRALLATRDRLQTSIDAWHRERRDGPIDADDHRAFLEEIGYLVAEPAPFTITTRGVDAEVATRAGPQLVVPALNARFLLNAANARWGSLYDALYGTDALGDPAPSGGYDPARGAAVVAFAKAFLDAAVPLAGISWTEWRGGTPPLADPTQLIGRRGDSLLLRHHGLHIEVMVDPAHPIGRDDPAGIADVVLESALTTIVDLEDSIAAVDAADKVAAYANWLSLLRGDLTATFAKDGRTVTRAPANDRGYTAADGGTLVLPGRSLLFVRTVGHLMTTPALLLPDASEAPEGIVDAIVVGLIGTHDVRGDRAGGNSAAGAIYVVKPKMHGPEECAFTDRLFDAVEDLLGLKRHTIKVGVMDEERRTSANLAACIHAVRHRICFINTGFLDRTGDEIHTNFEAGPMVPKAAMRDSTWLAAYEDRNVRIGLACGLGGRAQIGKGMWAAPDRMAEMLAQKGAHPIAGASTAWVPSPTAATLHAIHYHRVDVAARQRAIAGEPVPPLAALLSIPLATSPWLAHEVRAELDNNAQGLLGYVVRWIDQGIGCSKVPDLADVGLMEDRATLRISSQHMANWLRHGVCSRTDIEEALERMAARVDQQNIADTHYLPLRRRGSLAMTAARAIVFEGARQPNGYTEPVLHFYRTIAKQVSERPPIKT